MHIISYKTCFESFNRYCTVRAIIKQVRINIKTILFPDEQWNNWYLLSTHIIPGFHGRKILVGLIFIYVALTHHTFFKKVNDILNEGFTIIYINMRAIWCQTKRGFNHRINYVYSSLHWRSHFGSFTKASRVCQSRSYLKC